jgi:hypothetical protein
MTGVCGTCGCRRLTRLAHVSCSQLAQHVGDGATSPEARAEARLALAAAEVVFQAVERANMPKRYASLP